MSMQILDAQSLIPQNEEIHRYDAPADVAEKLSDGFWTRQPHLQYISDKIAEIRNKPLRLLITIPPGHGKSELISHWTPVWALSEWPRLKIGLGTYEANFGAYWGRQVRNSITEHETDLGIRLSRDSTSASTWELETGGGMFTAGVGGPMTGRRFNLLIIDDPIKNIAEAESITYREAIWKWYLTVARTRLYSDGSIIIIMTRWNDDDLVGRLLTQSTEPWEHICLPAIAEQNDILGRAEGEPLCPAFFDTDALNILRENVGGTTGRYWLALYQQRPTKEEGTTFKVEWWQYYKELPPLDRIAQYWDTAYKTKATSDYNVCLTLGKHKNGICALDLWRGKLEFPELLRMFVAQNQLHTPNIIKVEDAASGQSLIQTIRRDTKIPVVKLTAQGSKQSRADQITGICEAGRISLPEKASWLATFLDEVTRFPGGVKDDIVDVLSYGIADLWTSAGKVDQTVKGAKRELEFKNVRNKEF